MMAEKGHSTNTVLYSSMYLLPSEWVRMSPSSHISGNLQTAQLLWMFL